MSATAYLNDLNQRYLAIHRTKEDFFWETYMGISDDHEGSSKAQTEWTQFLSQASQISEINQQLDAAENISDAKKNKAQWRVLKAGWTCLKPTRLKAKRVSSLKPT